ncbi:MAG TPA: PilZ domain-containing protein [Lachnospiraceae bacterium]|nr:PilZ domain-containing protein [Lachnospiraceae bacterium]
MEEKRRSRRMVLNAHLVMKPIGETVGEKVPVDIIDISKDGIGFACAKPLTMNAIYEIDLTIWTKDVIHTFINVTRYDSAKNMYGATFTGLNENDSSKIRIYEMFDRASKEL